MERDACHVARIGRLVTVGDALPKDTLWSLDPHTAAKHRILRCYLDAWLPIMGSWNGRILIIDGFAGPGRYTGGEDGSPLIALRAVLEHRHLAKHVDAGLEVRFHFVEERKDRVAVLQEELVKFQVATPLPKGVYLTVAADRFDAYLGKILTSLESSNQRMAPTFAFIDPFGFSGVPMRLIERLAKASRAEVLISFMFESINRFAGHQPKIEEPLDELYGTKAWRPIAAETDPDGRRRGLIDLYRKQLMAAGFPLVSNFKMLDKGNRTEYFLYYGTTSPKGLSHMKRAMWKADPERGSAFSDHIALNPQLLLVPATQPAQTLTELLLQRFKGQRASIETVSDFVLKETIFSETSHLKRATLAPLERGTRIEVLRPPGRRSIAGQYPPGTKIRFLA
jgi:three-Cys-motif partner protein